MNNHDFSNAKEGDLVTSLMYGHGVIEKVDFSAENYQILVKFLNVNYNKFSYYSWFTTNGKIAGNNFAPTLFKGHIDINSLSINYNTI